jgi:hypothetical protein
MYALKGPNTCYCLYIRSVIALPNHHVATNNPGLEICKHVSLQRTYLNKVD